MSRPILREDMFISPTNFIEKSNSTYLVGILSGFIVK